MNIQIFGKSKCFDTKKADAALIKYLAHDEAKLEKLFEDPRLIKTPVVRNGRQATVGYAPEIWKTWE